MTVQETTQATEPVIKGLLVVSGSKIDISKFEDVIRRHKPDPLYNPEVPLPADYHLNPEPSVDQEKLGIIVDSLNPLTDPPAIPKIWLINPQTQKPEASTDLGWLADPVVLPDGQDTRVFRHYTFLVDPQLAIRVRQNPVAIILSSIAGWVSAWNKDSNVPDDKKFTSVLVDQGVPVAGTDGGGSDSKPTPVDDGPIPVPDITRELYLDQYGYSSDYLQRIGLKPNKEVTTVIEAARTEHKKKMTQNAQASAEPLAQNSTEFAASTIETGEEEKLAYGAPVYDVHSQAQGEGAVILVLDKIPFTYKDEQKKLGGQPKDGVDWSGVDAIIDLMPQIYSLDPYVPPSSTANARRNRVEPKQKESDYILPNHGLMVANQCKLIAPKAKIILVRVIDDTDHGNSSQISQFLFNLFENRAKILEVFDAPDREHWFKENTPVVVNMSFVVENTLPEQVDAWSLYKTVAYICSQPGQPEESDPKVVFVCASGNASQLGQARNPMEPAAYGYFPGYSSLFGNIDKLTTEQAREDSAITKYLPRTPYNLVIGVAASHHSLPNYYEWYSNASNLVVPATEVLLDPGEDIAELKEVQIDPKTGKYKHIGDIPSAQYARGPNSPKTRFIRWSGTSFAAPVVSGLAALLMGMQEGKEALPATEVKTRIWQTAILAAQDTWNRPREVHILNAVNNNVTKES